MSNLNSNGVSDIELIKSEFDAEYYLAGFPAENLPIDPFNHYISIGWTQARKPCSWFYPEHYLSANHDVAIAGVNPFLHYLKNGRSEGRNPNPILSNSLSLIHQQNFSSKIGPLWEDIIERKQTSDVKAIAYYLPQYHVCPENDAFWGKGFTDWRNVSRALPRFKDHLQPRVPAELGYYDLLNSDVYRRQIELAKLGGLHAFCFYYYSFGERRVLDGLLEKILANPTLDFPYTLMWANESWTNTWGDGDGRVLINQDYSDATLDYLMSGLARHFRDRRYMRIDGRPLLFIYNIGEIPEPKLFFKKIRDRFKTAEDVDPLIYMAQTFGNFDPDLHGLDGAIQFPPHNSSLLANISHTVQYFKENDPGCRIFDYDEVVGFYGGLMKETFPLIRCCAPSWDNEPRRPGNGLILHNSTPSKFTRWVRLCAQYARNNPIHGGEKIIAVNAWNEWAEGAFLEPDMHYGYAYLNALGRGLRHEGS